MFQEKTKSTLIPLNKLSKSLHLIFPLNDKHSVEVVTLWVFLTFKKFNTNTKIFIFFIYFFFHSVFLIAGKKKGSKKK